MTRLFTWSQHDTPAVLIDTTDQALEDLVAFYTEGRGSGPLLRILEIASGHGVRTILIEQRYIDIDWRSEHAAFYGTTFVRYPSVCHRAHFFAETVADLSDLSSLAGAYRGYCVLRPLASAPVGRTMITPPQELDDGVQCFAMEKVDVLGWPMWVTAMPFVSQDGQYLRCAHAAMWMVLHHAHVRRGHTRSTPRDIHDATLGGLISGRQVPSEGPTVSQVLGGLTTLGLSPGQFRLPSTKEKSEAAAVASGTTADLSLFGVLARYVNSNLPPMIVSDASRHAWLVVAYTRKASAAHPTMTLYRHDDARGPYLPVGDPWDEPQDRYRDWTSALLPLPSKIYMTAERAEAMGRWWFELHFDAGASRGRLREAHKAKELTFQTYGISAREYKHGLVNRRSIDLGLARAYRLSQWPRNLWVTEAVDRRLRVRHQPCVLGEVIIDSTAHHEPSEEEHGILSSHASTVMTLETPDHRREIITTTSGEPYETGRPVP